MLKKKLGKKIIEMESFFEEILVCADKDRRPFLEVFVHEPENINQKELGTLFGIFEINDDFEDSSYIVNYLISVVKKEYFSRPKRGTVESFEAALHKANLALAKLAEYGNINWIGKINALCAVAEKQNLHLTQTGNTLALLLRKGYLTNISEDLSPENLEPNPLKTFVNISSGKLENRDKLIVLTANVLDILDLEEIKNNALNFSEKDFVQFLKTVLVNKLEKAAALVVDVKEKEEIILPAVKKAENLNAFSSSAFAKSSRKKEPALEIKAPEIENQFLPEEQKMPQVGHLYIKESAEPPKTKKTFSFAFFQKRTYPGQPESISQTQTQKIKEKLRLLWENIKAYPFGEKFIRGLKFFGHGLQFIFSFLKNTSIWITNKLIGFCKRPKSVNVDIISNSSAPETISQEIFPPATEKKFRFRPDFSALKNLFARLNTRQKLFVLGAIFLIFIVPFFIVKIQKNIAAKKLAGQVVETIPVVVPLENEPALTRLENLNSVANFSEKLIALINLKSKFFALTDSKIFDLENQTEFPLPETFGKIQVATGMDDLNLIILINPQGQALAFSPISKKFQSNNLTIPADAKITLAGTYLTYLYLVDEANNQIYRYPRAEGGFGAKTNWKKDAALDISESSGMAINENIYLATPDNLLKFFRGQKQDFAIADSPTKIAPFKIATKIDGQYLWILDKTNSRIVKLDLTGQILAQYYHSEIANSTDFAVNEETSTAYFSTGNSVQSFLAN